MELQKLPWRAIRRVHYILRRTYFSVDPPETPGLVAHLEPEPLAYPKKHLSDKHVDWQTGLDQLTAVLDAADEDYVEMDS